MENVNNESEKTDSDSKSEIMGNPLIVVGGVVAAVLVLVGVVFFAVKSGNSSTTSPSARAEKTKTAVATSSPQVEATSSSKESSESAKAREISIEAGSFYYKPAQIKVKKGEKIKITMKSVDMMHDFNIDELDVTIPVTKSGSTGTVEFVATKTGTFEYYCSVGQHRKNGQVGKIIVE